MMDRGRYNEQTEEGKLAKKIKNFIYHPTDIIGSGFSSQVFKGMNQLDKDSENRIIAIKVIQLSKVQNQVEKYLFNNEVNALKSIKHPNVLHTIDILMTKNNVYLITQFCEGGDLLNFVKKNGKFTELEALRVMRDIVDGYICVEDMKIIHRDLKTANIFLKKGVAKIADFGFCQFIGDKKPQVAYNVGSPAYMSPEAYKQNHYSSKSDIWGIGIILYEIIVGQTPDKNLTYTQMVTNLMNGRITNIKNDQIIRILTLCFKKNLNERIAAKNLLELVKAQITILQSAEKQNGRVLPRGKPPTSMLNSVPATMTGQFRENRLFSPAKKQIKFNRTDNRIPQANIRDNNNSQMSDRNNQNSRNSKKYSEGQQYVYSQLKDQTEMLLFLYRLLKFLGTQALFEKIIQTHLILFRHRNFVNSLVQNLQMSPGNQEQYQQFKYLRTRFDEVYLQISKDHPMRTMYRQKFEHFSNQSFLEPEALHLYRAMIKEACTQCILIFQTRSDKVNWNQLGVILDYLIIQYQILGLHISGLSFNQIIKMANLDSIIRQQPHKVTDAHLQLLKYKFNKCVSQTQNIPEQNKNSPFLSSNSSVLPNRRTVPIKINNHSRI